MIRRTVLALISLMPLAACSSNSETAAGSTAGTGGGSGVPGGGVTSAELGGPRGPIVPGSQQDLEVNVGDRVFFAFDSAALDDAARQTLERQAAWLKQYPAVSVTIEGHCDERGTREYNLALGERRAQAVKNYLVALGISPDRIRTISYGEERPADPGHDETAWALNRRAVTVVNVTG
ncbi:MAG: peptidoglycan-associated lipoprotein Pal [Geminicoccaceae bacterium]|nr:peptidoglycan-associated lipoprotein Pal [Geminicoccaceae bacterium]MCS7267021.1 peptidoglycan-associated lipoprotein Pal [Geminicoccaceae bacterium]MCX7628752.1 peptidoglycan-associated lipoprotein Pal [Geminicoccaceae bacterium]MDW8123358.1 peptidoglycan-associated lipoprotein Pal [Geminicoccaceae bacterium]MDW8341568.1 peptidoglycan-associated lipoprotein Pal [Geminicoccaceae bacterium]